VIADRKNGLFRARSNQGRSSAFAHICHAASIYALNELFTPASYILYRMTKFGKQESVNNKNSGI
jgi:hypothetical protein